MKQLPDEETMSQLLSMGKDLEDGARKIYEMSEAFAQKYQQQLENKSVGQEDSANPVREIPNK